MKRTPLDLQKFFNDGGMIQFTSHDGIPFMVQQLGADYVITPKKHDLPVCQYETIEALIIAILDLVGQYFMEVR